MAKEKRVKVGKMENAPPWYGTPLDKLHFEWDTEEKLELERYCEKILKNAKEEDMTPRQRFVAAWEGKDKDRILVDGDYMLPFSVRVLDGHADMLKPGDAYKWPKLAVKANLAMTARFKLDYVNLYVISYAENFFGADCKMIDYGTPMIMGSPPIKTMEDLEDLGAPDPFTTGLCPGYLWSIREVKRILAQHGADKVMPVVASYCGGPIGTAMMSNIMMSMPNYMKSLMTNDGVAKKAMEVAAEWSAKFGRAVASLDPDALYLCDVTGVSSAKGYEWMLDMWAYISKYVKQGKKLPYMYHWVGLQRWMDWMPHYPTHGALGLGPDQFNGWWVGWDMPSEEIYAFSRDLNVWCVQTVSDLKLLEGHPDLEGDIKLRCELAKKHPKHGIAFGTLDYWTPWEHLDNFMAWVRKYGKF